MLCKTSQKRFEYVSKTSWKGINKNSLTWWYVLKTSWRHLCKTSWRCLKDVFARRLEDVLNTSWKRLEDVFWRRKRKTSRRRLQDVSMKTNVCWEMCLWKHEAFRMASFWFAAWSRQLVRCLLIATLYKIVVDCCKMFFQCRYYRVRLSCSAARFPSKRGLWSGMS